MVEISPYPVYTSISLLLLILNLFLYLNNFINNYSLYGWLLTFITLLGNIFLWFNDIIKESLYGSHFSNIIQSFYFGFFLFILSEFFIFSSFFFSLFYLNFIPDIILSSFWPPIRNSSFKFFFYSFI